MVRRLRGVPGIVVVCGDGRTSALVARCLAMAGLGRIRYLAGGLKGWRRAGGPLAETGGSGRDHLLPPHGDPTLRYVVRRTLEGFNVPVIATGLALSANLVLGVALRSRP